jgi:hypothetical protein
MTRKMLDTNDYLKIAKDWESKTIEQLAEEVGVSVNTIRKAGATLRQKDPSLCAKAKRRTRDDIAEEAIRILRSQAA